MMFQVTLEEAEDGWIWAEDQKAIGSIPSPQA
jgi:hypothetical protein